MTAKIYKIIPFCDAEEGDVYFGSTNQYYLCSRLTNHKYDYKRWKNNKHHFVSSFAIFEKYGFENCKIELVEEFNDINKIELLTREKYYIENFKCVNSDRPIISEEDRKKYKAEWYQKNKHRPDIIERQKISSKKSNEKLKSIIINCECGREYGIHHKSRHLQSQHHKLQIQLQTDPEFRKIYEENKKKENDDRIERIKKYKAEWHQKNK